MNSNLNNFVEDSKYIYYITGEIFSKFTKRFLKYGKTKDGYLHFSDYNNFTKKNKLVHRAIYEKFYEVNLYGLQVDHINNVKDDNRLVNLQILNHTQNCQKQLKYKNNTSGFTGVSYHKQCCKWRSDIRFNEKLIYLGLFDSIEEAKNAYNEKAKYLNDNHDCHYILNTDT